MHWGTPGLHRAKLPPPSTSRHRHLSGALATPRCCCSPGSSPRSSRTTHSIPQLALGMLFCFQEEPRSPSCPRSHSHGLDVCRWHPCDSPAPCSSGTCDQAWGPRPHCSVSTAASSQQATCVTANSQERFVPFDRALAGRAGFLQALKANPSVYTL